MGQSQPADRIIASQRTAITLQNCERQPHPLKFIIVDRTAPAGMDVLRDVRATAPMSKVRLDFLVERLRRPSGMNQVSPA
jgi:hypothetical protein